MPTAQVLQPGTDPHMGTATATVEHGDAPSRRHGSDTLRKLVRAYHTFARPQEAEHRLTPAFIAIAAVIYGALYFSIGSVFLPGHAAWCTLLLWASAQIGGFIAYQVRLPRVIGMICAGLLMRNIPWSAVSAFPPKWGTQMRAAALGTIFLRCGLELDLNTMRRYKMPAVRLALLPGLAEAFYSGGIATAPGIFGMPVLLGFTMGFILKAVGPGLVVPAMFKLQRIGLGRDQGIPSTIVISASFDDIVAITGFAIFSHIAITGSGEDNVAWEIAQGPTQVVFGIVGGLIGGFILGCTRVFRTRLYRLAGLFFGAMLIMFFLEYYGMLSGGALGALMIGLTTSNFWERGFPRRGSLGANLNYSPEIERVLAIVWAWVMEPMLFVTIGQSIYFKSLGSGTIPKALIIIFTGLILRMICTFVVMSGMGYNVKERLFYAFAWTPKATVQAALSGTPLAMIQAAKRGSQDYAQWEAWGYDILTTGVFTIIVNATIGLLLIHFSAHRFLEMAQEPDESEKRQEESDVHRTLERSLSAHSNGSLTRRKQKLADQYEKDFRDSTVSLEDYEVVALYLDAISELSSLVSSGDFDQEELKRLSDYVTAMKAKVEQEVGQRQLTVRELFRSASLLAANQPVVIRRTRSMPVANGESNDDQNAV